MGWRACGAVVLAVLWPGLVLAQEKTGVVTQLEGQVTAARVAVPQLIELKFKDDVYRNDRITTGDRALARMLLGGKAVVTVRERSVITITETPGKSTIGLVAGKIGLAVAKERMRPGESIEVKTVNAVCAVRGTVIVAEVESTTAQAAGSAPGIVTRFYVLRGLIDATQFVPGTTTPLGATLPVGTMEFFTAAGAAPANVQAIAPDQMAQITGGLTPKGLRHEQGTTDQVVNDQLSMFGWQGKVSLDLGCCPPPRPPLTATSTQPSEMPGQTPPGQTPPGPMPPGQNPPGQTPPPPLPSIPPIPPVPPIPPIVGDSPDPGGKLKGLDRADSVAGPHGAQGRQNARDKQGR